jgi:dihydrofolate reductase
MAPRSPLRGALEKSDRLGKGAAMGKLVINVQISLDGVMQGPGGPDEDTSGGFKQGGWAMPYFDESMAEASSLGMASTGGLVLGRRTYDIFAGYWPHQGDDAPFASFLNKVPKHVASRTLKEPLVWANSRLIQGDVAEGIRKLKEGSAEDLVVLGSGDLAQTLMEHDLIDRYDLWIVPIVLGGGKRLFREGSSLRLKLVDEKRGGTGVLVTTYTPEKG